MSASEKLKALEQRLALAQGVEWDKETADVLDIFPQIVAVVEALEEITRLTDNATEHYNDLGMAEVARAALALLDEALRPE